MKQNGARTYNKLNAAYKKASDWIKVSHDISGKIAENALDAALLEIQKKGSYVMTFDWDQIQDLTDELARIKKIQPESRFPWAEDVKAALKTARILYTDEVARDFGDDWNRYRAVIGLQHTVKDRAKANIRISEFMEQIRDSYGVPFRPDSSDTDQWVILYGIMSCTFTPGEVLRRQLEAEGDPILEVIREAARKSAENAEKTAKARAAKQTREAASLDQAPEVIEETALAVTEETAVENIGEEKEEEAIEDNGQRSEIIVIEKHETTTAAAAEDARTEERTDSEPGTDEERIRAALERISGIGGLEAKVKGGYIIWINGETYQHRDELKAAGYRWSAKKKAWWWSVAMKEKTAA